MSKHTPGPWIQHGTYIICINEDDETFGLGECIATAMYRDDDEEMEANARLIAVAPRMYEYIAFSASNGCIEAIKIMEVINASS